MNANDILALEGKTVLVRPADGGEISAVGVRGHLRVTQGTEAPKDLLVSIVISLPHMFNRPACDKSLPLTPTEVEQLLRTEVNGAYAYDYPGQVLPTADDRAAETHLPGSAPVSAQQVMSG